MGNTKARLRKIEKALEKKGGGKGRIIVYCSGEPVPEHGPDDILIHIRRFGGQRPLKSAM